MKLFPLRQPTARQLSREGDHHHPGRKTTQSLSEHPPGSETTESQPWWGGGGAVWRSETAGACAVGPSYYRAPGRRHVFMTSQVVRASPDILEAGPHGRRPDWPSHCAWRALAHDPEPPPAPVSPASHPGCSHSPQAPCQ